MNREIQNLTIITTTKITIHIIYWLQLSENELIRYQRILRNRYDNTVKKRWLDCVWGRTLDTDSLPLKSLLQSTETLMLHKIMQITSGSALQISRDGTDLRQTIATATALIEWTLMWPSDDYPASE